jgi:hypothetical protein
MLRAGIYDTLSTEDVPGMLRLVRVASPLKNRHWLPLTQHVGNIEC